MQTNGGVGKAASTLPTMAATPLSFPWGERLVGEGQGRRSLNDDEASIGGFMAGIARACEAFESRRELRPVPILDGTFDFADWRYGHRFDHVADRHSFVVGHSLGNVLQQLFEFIGLVIREVPVSSVTRQPELGVVALHHHHVLHQARCVGLRSLAAGPVRGRRKGETYQQCCDMLFHDVLLPANEYATGEDQEVGMSGLKLAVARPQFGRSVMIDIPAVSAT